MSHPIIIQYQRKNWRYQHKFETCYVIGTMQALSLCKHCFRTASRKSRTTKVRRPGGFAARVDDALRYIKSLPGKSYGPRAGFLARIQRGGMILHSLHNAPGHGVSVRLHFETLSKLGNCIKSDLYLSVLGILASRVRCNVTNFARLDELKFHYEVQESSTSVTSLQRKVLSLKKFLSFFNLYMQSLSNIKYFNIKYFFDRSSNNDSQGT